VGVPVAHISETKESYCPSSSPHALARSLFIGLQGDPGEHNQSGPAATLAGEALGPQGKKMTHKYAVGQKVDLTHRMLQITPSGQYEVIRLVPDPESSAVDALYRIKSLDEAYQRVVQESELRPSKVEPIPPRNSLPAASTAT
jgi:hypothetical protein